MAFLERTHCLRELSSSSSRLLRGSLLLKHSSAGLSCTRLPHAVIEAVDDDKEGGGKVKSEVVHIPQQEHRSSHGLSRRRARTAKVANVQEERLFDEETDSKFMREALCEARKAAASGEVPVGAVLVSKGKVITRAYNRVERENDPTAHAEMICIRNTARYLGGWRLIDSTLYVTLEPCPMCAGALLQARVNTVVWGARNKLLGADGSWASLFPRHSLGHSNGKQLCHSKADRPAEKGGLIHPFNPNITVRGGILASDCSKIMIDFFQQRRKGSKSNKGRALAWSLLHRLISAIQKMIHLVVSFFKGLGIDGGSLKNS